MRFFRPHMVSFALIFTLTGLLAVPLYAADAKAPAPRYVAPETLPPLLLPPPPSENSAAWRKEAHAVEAAQQHVAAADLAAMRDEQHVRLDLMTSVMGEGFTRDRMPKTFALLDHVMAESAQVVEADKQFWRIKRPYLIDKHVQLRVDPLDDSPAYPSGHTAESRVLAEVLGMLMPDKLQNLRDRAEQIAWHRVQAGVHYPADIQAGRMLAMLITGALLANEDFQYDLSAAKREIADAAK